MTKLLKRLSDAIYVRLNRERILVAVRSDLKSAWPYIECVWGRASGLYRSRIGASARKPFELAILEELVKVGPVCEKLLVANLLHANPYVAAYCLLCLEQLSSREINTLPKELFNRIETIVVHTGSFALTQRVGEFAQQVCKASAWRGCNGV